MSYEHVKKYMRLPVSQLSFRLTSANMLVKLLQVSFPFASLKPIFYIQRWGHIILTMLQFYQDL